MSNKAKALGLFSKLSRKSVSDLSEWNKNDERLMQCVEQTNLKDIITLVKKKKVCSTKLDPQGHSALHVAAMRNKYDVVQLLIAYSANVTAVDFQGRTALHCAARHGASDVLEVLCHSKEDDWPRDESKMTALHHACIGGDLDCIINLIRKYPKDLEASDEDGRTPLFYSSQIGHLSVCKELLDRGASVNVQDKFGRTPLMCAAENGNRLIAELFVNKGANIELCDSHGRTATWHAMDAGHTAVKQTIDPSPPLASKSLHGDDMADYPGRQRVHSPIIEENESMMGDDDTLPIRFRSHNIGSELRISEGDADEDVIDIRLDTGDSDDEFRDSILSDSDDDGSISPRLSELSYTMSRLQEDNSITASSLSLASKPADQSLVAQGRQASVTSNPAEDEDPLPLDILAIESLATDLGKPVMVTDLDADVSPSTKDSVSDNINKSLDVEKPPRLASSIESNAAAKQSVEDTAIANSLVIGETSVQKSYTDILTMSDGISLTSEDETEVPAATLPPAATADDNKELEKAHMTLKTNYDCIKVEYDDMLKRIRELEMSRRHSREEQEVTEHMDMLLQLSEVSSKLDDEQCRNRQLQAQVKTLENLAGGAVARATDSKQKVGELDPDNWMEYAEEEDDSDDEFGFPGLCLLNNTSGKLSKDEVKPVAKVSGRPRQISLKEENREIAKLKTEIESLERQKHSLTEALTHTQSNYEESEHSRKKLLSELDVSKTTVDVKSQESTRVMNENNELQQRVTKYKERSVATVEHAKTYKKEVEKLNKKLELYDREYRKVKERLKKKDANERRMLKDRQNLMRKADEAGRKLKESEKCYEEMRKSSHAEADELMVKCEELDSELVVLKDFNEDQSYEIERLTDLVDCSEEMLELKQLEVESLEKQITLMKDISLSPRNPDSLRDTKATIKSLQDQITKLQAQLAETATKYQETIDIYRNNLILASKNLLNPDVSEALLHVIELRKLT